MIASFIAALLVAMVAALGLALVFLPATIAVPIFYAWAVNRSVTERASTHAWRTAASPWPAWIVAAISGGGFALVVGPLFQSRVSAVLVVGAVVAIVGPAIAALLVWRRDEQRTLRSDLLACSPLLGQALVAATAFGFESGKLVHLATAAILESLGTPWGLLLVTFWITFPIAVNAGKNAGSQPTAYRTATWLVAVVATIALLGHAGFQPSQPKDVPVVGIVTIVLVPILAFAARRSYRPWVFAIAAVVTGCLVSQANFWSEEVALVGTAVVLAVGPAIDVLRRARDQAA